eukprot:4106991-Amphidinium_carterae.1
MGSHFPFKPAGQQCLLTRLVSYIIIEVPAVQVAPREDACARNLCLHEASIPDGLVVGFCIGHVRVDNEMISALTVRGLSRYLQDKETSTEGQQNFKLRF